jgi:hypothetical protein
MKKVMKAIWRFNAKFNRFMAYFSVGVIAYEKTMKYLEAKEVNK